MTTNTIQGTQGTIPGVGSSHDPFSPFDPYNGNGVLVGSSLNSNAFSITGSIPELDDVRKIQGKMFQVQHKITASSGELNLPVKELQETMKDKLIMDLLYEMKKNNLISFTSKTDMETGDVTYIARVFATPNDQTQYLRKRFDEL